MATARKKPIVGTLSTPTDSASKGHRIRRLLRIIAGVVLTLATIGLLVFAFRVPILESVSRGLDASQPPLRADAAFVLSGSPWDRGLAGAMLYKQKFVKRIICTGEMTIPDLRAFDSTMIIAQVTRKRILDLGVPPPAVEILPIGTSTREELVAIGDFCRQQRLKDVIIVSSMLHTRRIRKESRIPLRGIHLTIVGAKSTAFEEDRWWRSENGLVAVTNEWIKSIYYDFTR
jgi:uncharacterized SAM-binding protein YcdF (DUF218 family)